jgi:hypothetical protein
MAQRRYLRRRNRHIQERDQRRLARELEEWADNMWEEQGQDQDQDICCYETLEYAMYLSFHAVLRPA